MNITYVESSACTHTGVSSEHCQGTANASQGTQSHQLCQTREKAGKERKHVPQNLGSKALSLP